MRTFLIPSTAEDEKVVMNEIKAFIEQWVGLLAERKYASAIELLSSEVPPGSGSVNSGKSPVWTPSLLEAVIANYGTPEPLPDLPPIQPKPFVVVPLDSALKEAFEANVDIEFDREAISKVKTVAIAPQQKSQGWLHFRLPWQRPSSTVARKKWLGGAEFALPLNFERGNDLSDLSVRMRLKEVTTTEMALVLLDIHVL